MPRPHPFDFAFGSVAPLWFPRIRASAQGTGRDPSDLAEFGKLEPVRAMLAEMQPEGEEPGSAEATEEYLRFLYAAFHFSEGGGHTTSLARESLERQLADVASANREAGATLHQDTATYYRLPEHRFWSRVSDSEPHEPMDGFFVVRGGASGGEWLVVAILGLREDRDGFSQISVTATGADLVSVIPATEPPLAPAMAGGDVAGFHSVSSVADMLLLTRLALASAAQ